jgi:hypothetical protein
MVVEFNSRESSNPLADPAVTLLAVVSIVIDNDDVEVEAPVIKAQPVAINKIRTIKPVIHAFTISNLKLL